MKQYVTPSLELLMTTATDVIRTSGDGEYNRLIGEFTIDGENFQW